MATGRDTGSRAGTVSAHAYLEALRPIVEQVALRAEDGVQRAADLIAAAVRAGGLVQAFGTGHSEALAMEISGRAGGLVPTNRIALRDIVIHGGADPSVLADGTIERDPALAARLYELAAPSPADAFVVASNSGVNGSTVEMARIAREHGHPVVAVTSLTQTELVPSRHPARLKLRDVADVVLDNGAPYGDSILALPGGGSVCAVSSITGALLAQLVVAEVVRRLLDDGVVPPVYLSANVPEGDEHNRALEARYAGRLRRTA